MYLADRQKIGDTKIYFEPTDDFNLDDIYQAVAFVTDANIFVNTHRRFVNIPTYGWCQSDENILRDFRDNLRFIRLTKGFLATA